VRPLHFNTALGFIAYDTRTLKSRYRPLWARQNRFCRHLPISGYVNKNRKQLRSGIVVCEARLSFGSPVLTSLTGHAVNPPRIQILIVYVHVNPRRTHSVTQSLAGSRRNMASSYRTYSPVERHFSMHIGLINGIDFIVAAEDIALSASSSASYRFLLSLTFQRRPQTDCDAELKRLRLKDSAQQYKALRSKFEHRKLPSTNMASVTLNRETVQATDMRIDHTRAAAVS
jgi:hypothetical protein